MVYSDINDIKASIGFTLDTNSRPTLLNAALIQGHAFRLMNGWMGIEPTADDNLKAVETELVVSQILAIHSKRPFPMRLTQEHKIILDDYRDTGDVSVNDFYFGYNSLA